METIRTPRIVQETSRRHLCQGKSIGLVPTMGALHEGHLSLVRRARDENDIVSVSIFVNPLQFGPNDDLMKYPRDIEGDRDKLANEGVHILFMPEPRSLYPEGYATEVVVRSLSDKLCGVWRPGHFAGVTTVVCKLFQIVKPTRAYFGQKDYQQTLIIRRMVEDLNMDVGLVICPTVRETDGLAKSSRNTYLSCEDRKAATVLHRALTAASHMIAGRTTDAALISQEMRSLLSAEPLVTEIHYAGLYDPETLQELLSVEGIALAAIAVKIGPTRLIDNMLIDPAR